MQRLISNSTRDFDRRHGTPPTNTTKRIDTTLKMSGSRPLRSKSTTPHHVKVGRKFGWHDGRVSTPEVPAALSSVLSVEHLHAHLDTLRRPHTANSASTSNLHRARGVSTGGLRKKESQRKQKHARPVSAAPLGRSSTPLTARSRGGGMRTSWDSGFSDVRDANRSFSDSFRKQPAETALLSARSQDAHAMQKSRDQMHQQQLIALATQRHGNGNDAEELTERNTELQREVNRLRFQVTNVDGDASQVAFLAAELRRLDLTHKKRLSHLDRERDDAVADMNRVLAENAALAEQVALLQNALSVDRNELANLKEDNERLLRKELGHGRAGDELFKQYEQLQVALEKAVAVHQPCIKREHVVGVLERQLDRAREKTLSLEEELKHVMSAKDEMTTLNQTLSKQLTAMMETQSDLSDELEDAKLHLERHRKYKDTATALEKAAEVSKAEHAQLVARCEELVDKSEAATKVAAEADKQVIHLKGQLAESQFTLLKEQQRRKHELSMRQRARALVHAAKPQLGMRVGILSKKDRRLAIKGFDSKSCAAYSHGLRKRDVLVSVDGHNFANKADFNTFVEKRLVVGQNVLFHVQRGEQNHMKLVVVGTLHFTEDEMTVLQRIATYQESDYSIDITELENRKYQQLAKERDANSNKDTTDSKPQSMIAAQDS